LLLSGPIEPAAKRELLEEVRAGGATDDEDVERVLLAGLVASPAFQWR
jgi:hypothetical protein